MSQLRLLSSGALAASILASGCGSSDSSAPAAPAAPAAPVAVVPVAAQPVAAPAPAAAAPVAPPVAAPAAGAQASNFGSVQLTPGFPADPHVVSGTAGGSVAAAPLGAGCAGHISERPDHIFLASGNFPTLRVMAWTASSDISLVIQKPDGTYLCNDDFETTDPLVSGTFPAGAYKVWVGTYAAGQTATYKLGFSEMPNVNPSSLQNS